MTDLTAGEVFVLRSGEHDFWDYPRQVRIEAIRPGPEPDAEYAQASIVSRSEYAPKHLAMRRRDHRPWTAAAPSGQIDVAIWEIQDVDRAWMDGVFHPPTTNPTAWGYLVHGDLESELAQWNASRGRGSP